MVLHWSPTGAWLLIDGNFRTFSDNRIEHKFGVANRHMPPQASSNFSNDWKGAENIVRVGGGGLGVDIASHRQFIAPDW